MDGLVNLLSSRNNGSNDQPIIDHVASSTDRLISDWTYAAGTSNHGTYGSYTLALVAAFDTPGLPDTVASQIAKTILDREVKLIYRALTMVRQAQTIPTLSLLQRFALVAPMDLFNQFDFTLKVIPKLLSQQPYRQSFLEFYMELIRKCPAPVRRELLSNRKVFSGWFGKLGHEDKDETVEQTLELLRTFVLMDVSVFTKTAKMGLFNDWTLKNLQRMLASPQLSEALGEKISQFIVTLLCDKTYGVRMPGENKLALSFLKIVKPWENVVQMDLVIRLLHEVPDLMAPYFESLATAYPFTPKVSMWWFSYSVLHIRALKLDPPKFAGLSDPLFASQPKSEVASRTIFPVTLTKAALLQALTFQDSKLVQFQAAQVILNGIRRLKNTLEKVYKPRNWDATQLIDEFLTARLPDPHLFAKPVEAALLQTTYLIILKEICQLRPVPVTLPISLAANEVKGLDLVQAEQLLEIQTITSDQTRWWNPNKGETSLFTQLLQFATFNVQLADKSSLLLQHLVQPTQLFADIKTLAHPIDALLFELGVYLQDKDSSSNIIWSLLEQTIQRVVRSPYQYIDKVRSLYVSPFVVALIEQYVAHFASKASDNGKTDGFIISFARSLAVLGEDGEIIEGLLQGVGENVQTNTESKKTTASSGTKYEEYFDFVLYAEDKDVLSRTDIVFKISNHLELAATLHRAANTSNEDLRNYLLASVPADSLPEIVQNTSAIAPFIRGSRALCRAFLSTIEGHSSDFLRQSLESSDKWDMALNLLSTEYLVEEKLLSEPDLSSAILKELTSRNYQVPVELLQNLVAVDGITENVLLWEPGTLDEQHALNFMHTGSSNPKFIAALIRASRAYRSDIPQALNPFVLDAAARYAPSKLDRRQALGIAKSLLENVEKEEFVIPALNVLAELLDHNGSEQDGEVNVALSETIWGSLTDYIEGAKSKQRRSVLLPAFVRIAEQKPPFISRWLKIVVHQLTRHYAEHTVTEGVLDFVKTFNASSVVIEELWQHAHPNAINALVEAALRNDHRAETYELIGRIALCPHRSKDSRFSSLSHLTTLYEATNPGSTSIEEIMAVYALYMAQPETNSTLEVEQGLLTRYTGSLLAKDQIILHLLELIESHRQRSWVENVESWEVRPAFNVQDVDDYGQEPLISLKNNTSLYVTLDEQRIRRCINEFEAVHLSLPQPDKGYAAVCEAVAAYELLIPESAHQHYDSRFLLSTVISCDYLLQNMDVFLSSGLLSFAICALADAGLRDNAHRLLVHVFNALPTTQFKDQTGTRLLLGKLLMLEQEMRDQNMPLPSHVPGIVGQIALLLARPTHFLHEKASSWLLASPKIYSFDVPLFKAIVQSSSDLKLRELLWLVNTIKSGLADKDAVAALIRSGVIEWCLSQYQLLSVKSKSIKDAVAKLVKRIEELQGGSMAVITGAGALAVPDFKQRLYYSAEPEQLAAWTQ